MRVGAAKRERSTKRHTVDYCEDPMEYGQPVQKLDHRHLKAWRKSFQKFAQKKEVTRFLKTHAGRHLFGGDPVNDLKESHPAIWPFVIAAWKFPKNFDDPIECTTATERCRGCRTLLGTSADPNMCVTHCKPNQVIVSDYFCEDCYRVAQRVVNIVDKICNFAETVSDETTEQEFLEFAYDIMGEWALVFSRTPIPKYQEVTDEDEEEAADECDTKTLLFSNACREISNKGWGHFMSGKSKYYKLVCEKILWKLQQQGLQTADELTAKRGLNLFHLALSSGLRVDPSKTKSRTCYVCNLTKNCKFTCRIPEKEYIGAVCVEFVHAVMAAARAIIAGVEALGQKDMSDKEQRRLVAAAACDYVKATEDVDVSKARSTKRQRVDIDLCSESSFTSTSSESEEDEEEFRDFIEKDDADTDSREEGESSYEDPGEDEEEEEEEEEEDTSNVMVEPSFLQSILEKHRPEEVPHKEEEMLRIPCPEFDVDEFFAIFGQQVGEAVSLGETQVDFLNLFGQPGICCIIADQETEVSWRSLEAFNTWSLNSAPGNVAKLRRNYVMVRLAYHHAMKRFWQRFVKDARAREFQIVPRNIEMPYLWFTVSWKVQ